MIFSRHTTGSFTSFLLLILVGAIFNACSPSTDTAKVTGTLKNLGSATAFIELQPIHYKYAKKRRYPLNTDAKGAFEVQVPAGENELAYLKIGSEEHALILNPGKTTVVEVNRIRFPEQVNVSSLPAALTETYRRWLAAEAVADTAIKFYKDDFSAGRHQETMEVFDQRLAMARASFANTLLEPIYLKLFGAHLTKQFDNVKYKLREGITGFDADSARASIISQAKDFNFFSYKVLKAQRAGIRDMTNGYAKSFGLQAIFDERFGKKLMEYDFNRVAYEELNARRMEILDMVSEPKARAYAEMHLVAERIGEAQFEFAEPSYNQYVNDYPGETEYIEFLATFFGEIKALQPGAPAVSFTLPDPEGNLHSLEDFRGKYVLPDFWAAWCKPCLEEFPHMNRMYEKYSRDDFEIVAISVEEEKSLWFENLPKFDNPWPQLFGEGALENETFRAMKGGGIPFYILVDPDGNIARYNDARPSFNLEEVLDELLAERAQKGTN